MFIICIGILAVSVNCSEKNAINTVKIIVPTSDDMETTISLFPSENKYYAFLPAYSNIEEVSVKSSSNYQIEFYEKSSNKKVLATNLKNDSEYTIKLKNLLGITVTEENFVIMKSANIATLSINLSNGDISSVDNDKTTNVSGSAVVINSKGDIRFKGAFKDFHSRGNASWLSAKKPYTIEFESDVELLDIGKASKWVLMANSYDPSNLKNKLAYDASKKLGMRYSCGSDFVDLYVDGEYRGLYLLVEKITIGDNQININNLAEETQALNFKKLSSYEVFEDSTQKSVCQYLKGYNIPVNPSDITGGYIIKSEMASRISEDSFFVTQNGNCYDCESPKYASKSQIEYISTLFNDIEISLSDYDKISNLIDVDSFAKRYLMQECFANCEGSSFYYIKDSDNVDSKIYAEPIWDFDNSLGTGDTEFPTGLYGGNYILNRLLKNEKFKQKVISMYAENFAQIYSEYKSDMIMYSNKLDAADKMNKIRWKNVYGENSNIHEKTQELIQYINDRQEFLDNVWILGKNYVNVIFDDPENIIDYFKSKSIEYGDSIGDVVSLERNGYAFLGWFNAETGEKFDAFEPVYEDCKFLAKWEIAEPKKEGLNNFDIIEELYLIKKDVFKHLDFYVSILLSVLFIFAFIILLIVNIPKKEVKKRGKISKRIKIHM